jgi:hypothetical protein
MSIHKTAAGATLALALFLTAHGDARARIVCDGEFQVNSGQAIATPYCADRYLAHVARTYGMRVSHDSIAYNPSTKRRVCEFIGYDSRLTNICAGWRNDAAGGVRTH